MKNWKQIERISVGIMILFMVILSVQLSVVVSEDCTVPKKVLNYEWNSTGTDEGGIYFPLGQQNDTSLVKELLYGSSLNADEDLPKLCPRLRFNETNAVISGVNRTSAMFKCDKKDGKKWMEECTYLGEKDKAKDYNYKLFVTLTDRKTFAFAVRCWANGLRGWTVMSKKKFLHDDVQIEILEHAKSLGFQTADTLPLRYKSCS